MIPFGNLLRSETGAPTLRNMQNERKRHHLFPYSVEVDHKPISSHSTSQQAIEAARVLLKGAPEGTRVKVYVGGGMIFSKKVGA